MLAPPRRNLQSRGKAVVDSIDYVHKFHLVRGIFIWPFVQIVCRKTIQKLENAMFSLTKTPNVIQTLQFTIYTPATLRFSLSPTPHLHPRPALHIPALPKQCQWIFCPRMRKGNRPHRICRTFPHGTTMMVAPKTRWKLEKLLWFGIHWGHKVPLVSSAALVRDG